MSPSIILRVQHFEISNKNCKYFFPMIDTLKESIYNEFAEQMYGFFVRRGKMSLIFNIDFEIASTAFISILYFYAQIQYNLNSEVNKEFRRLMLYVLSANIIDILSAITISYYMVVPVWLNMIVNTVYFTLTILMCYQFIYYSYIYVQKSRFAYWVWRVNKLVLCFYGLLLALNIFTGHIFYFNELGQYTHGKYYLTNYAVSYYSLVSASVVLFSNFRKWEKRQKGAVIIFTLIEPIGPLLQMLVCPDVLLSIFSVSLSLIMIMFSMETPDYHKLTEAMAELKRTKEEAEAAREQAQKANQAKSEFLSNMSHEIRTPINAILGMNEMILRESGEDEICAYASDVENSGRMLLSLVNDILDFSKIESGFMHLVLAEYELSSALNDVITMIQPKAAEKGLKLQVEISPEIPNRLCGDARRICQIILNLLTNAVKYTDEGEVHLQVTHKEIEENRIELCVAVKDTGRGIRESEKEKLFHSFSRLDEQKNRGIEGTGLGLAITNSLVQMMNGRLELESVYGVGSLFTIHIQQEVRSRRGIGDWSSRIGISQESDGKQEDGFFAPQGQILVVDDVNMNLKVFAGLLKDSKIQIDMAMGGAEALAYCKKRTYHMIFMDHMMPEMDGIECMRELRAMKESLNQQTPVIMLTANAIAGVRDEYLKEGFSDYLSKPFKRKDLMKMIRKYLPEELIQRKEPMQKVE